MGGTGKSPHTLYIHDLIAEKNATPIAFLSRGYGRKTRGLLEVHKEDTADQVGDEPLMFRKRIQGGTVVVSEDRKQGVEYILDQVDQPIILLDDAYQHRKVTAGFAILLTDYHSPYYRDFVVPAGRLREWKSGRKRADCVVVTKCPENLGLEEKKTMIRKLKTGGKPVFFSQIEYGERIAFGRSVENTETILLVTGIANPKPLENYLKRYCRVVTMAFPDHHNYSTADIAEIHGKIGTFASENTAIVTTEKDYVRLEPLLSPEDKEKYPWYYQSIRVRIDEEETFKALINRYVDTI